MICILQPIPAPQIPINAWIDRRICLTRDRLKLRVIFWRAGREVIGEQFLTTVNRWWITGDRHGDLFPVWVWVSSACLLDVCVYTCAYWVNVPISSDVIYIPSAVRALRSPVITLLWALSNRTKPIYNVTPVPRFSEGATEISAGMSVLTLWPDVKFIYLTGLYLLHFNDLIRTEDSCRKPHHAWRLFVLA